jgi:hypothetical protein
MSAARLCCCSSLAARHQGNLVVHWPSSIWGGSTTAHANITWRLLIGRTPTWDTARSLPPPLPRPQPTALAGRRIPPEVFCMLHSKISQLPPHRPLAADMQHDRVFQNHSTCPTLSEARIAMAPHKETAARKARRHAEAVGARNSTAWLLALSFTSPTRCVMTEVKGPRQARGCRVV